ncbi:Lrp/AsnC family transcriptional regulator [Streptomyces sp. NPDC048172]|uniref:Lrp/AsnC family transcriptional regulator n=1 Tax=Streptomyces sp. NPDC048172 TaxID=3365505 RepID=UPI00372353E0
MAVDRLDHQILHALGVNGRIAFRQLATVLDAGEHTVARRYRALVERGVVRVVAMPSPRDDDNGQLLRLHVHPGSGTRLADALARRDDVAWIRTAGAGGEILCGVRAASAPERDHLLLEQLPRTGRVTAVTVYEVLHHFRTPGHADWEGFPHPLDDEQRDRIRADAPPELEPPGTAPPMTAEDTALLRALSQDARQSAARVAAATGQTEATVRRRLETLLSSAAIRLDRDLDPLQLGHPIGATLYLDVAPGHLHHAGAALARHGPTTFVAAVTGPANLYAGVVTRTIHDLYTYVHSTLADIEGVRHIETSLTGPYVKHARTVRTPDGVNKVLPHDN